MKSWNKKKIAELAKEQGLIPPFNHEDAETAIALTEAAYRGGLRIIEFTNRSENALEIFSQLARHCAKKMPALALGIGTIMNVKQAKQFRKAGAQFIVAPILNSSVGAWCKKEDIFWCPGAGSATEAVQAHEWGASLVKLFPAEVLGPEFIKALKGPCPWVNVMPSGGVTTEKDNLKRWFDSGAYCVAIGSHLFSKQVMQEKKTDQLEENVRNVLSHIASVRA
jgi:2-dehydro-3-deoxyphosphogluconate aldolase/(4S)-4-hydroxy-2-oxoglutarate aldolase